MKQIFYKILISLCMLHIGGVFYGMKSSEIPIKKMDVQQLTDKLSELKKALTNPILKNSPSEKKLINDKIIDIEKRLIEKESQLKSGTTGTKRFKEQAEHIRKLAQEKNPLKQSKAKVEHDLKDIQNIQKLVATSDKLFVMYSENQSKDKKVSFKIAKLDQENDFAKIDMQNPNVPELPDPEEQITWLKKSAQSFCDIAAYENTYAYGYFFEKKTWGPSQSDMSMIDFVSKNGYKKPSTNTHKTFIRSLFLDDQFIVSHSKAGNIRFIPITELQNEGSYLRTIEYKAERLVAYNNKCMVYEKSTILSGTALFIAYIDDTLNIITDKKIGSYFPSQKDEPSPYLASIDKNGHAFAYDQRNRSLTVCMLSDNKIVKYVYKSTDLPKQLAYRVAKQIHAVGNGDTAILVFDDQIYTVSSGENQIVESKCIFSSPISSSRDELKTIETTALQNDNKLWIISSKEPYNNKEEANRKYSIQLISLNND